MRFGDFKAAVKKYPLFRSSMFSHLTDDVPTLRRQVSEWCHKGLLIQLKRGVYTLLESDREVKFSRFFLANQLYSPSYISLESALSYYNLIPEGVNAVTSVSSKKTQRFENAYGSFQYSHIKTELFSGYMTTKDEFNNNIVIATKERALVDLLYLKTRGLKASDPLIFTENFRLQNLEVIDQNKLLNIAEMFKQKKLINLVKLLMNHWR